MPGRCTPKKFLKPRPLLWLRMHLLVNHAYYERQETLIACGSSGVEEGGKGGRSPLAVT